jgi:hypothetical protein
MDCLPPVIPVVDANEKGALPRCKLKNLADISSQTSTRLTP